jgi:hypothetical protein
MIAPRLFRRSVPVICLGGLCFLTAANALLGQVAPVGAWDFVLTGNQRGVVKAEFFEDGTMQGIGVLTLNTPAPLGTGFTNVFGSVVIQGAWLFERTNRISGFMNLVSQVDTNFTTNGLSFHGNGKPTRLNLMAFGTPGKINFKGIPLTDTNVVDLGGASSFLGRLTSKNFTFARLEIFSLATVQPNFYSVDGGGPGYVYSGNLLISNQGTAALAQYRAIGTGLVPAATYVGPFNVNTRKGTLRGMDGTNAVVKFRITPEAQ